MSYDAWMVLAGTSATTIQVRRPEFDLKPAIVPLAQDERRPLPFRQERRTRTQDRLHVERRNHYAAGWLP